MSPFSLSAFESALMACLPQPCAGAFCVAFSGGLDSSVLLHALSELRAAHSEWRVRAVHVDHQLHPDSSRWSSHCADVAAKLNIELTVARVNVHRDHPQGMEAAARAARYDALRRVMSHGEALLTAHHADDQAETLMLALLRGSGVQGLAAMPSRKPFAQGWHLRPLLPFARAHIDAWAHEQGIPHIADPSNALLRHDRNFLRHQITPRLAERWPSAAASMARSARHVGEALALLDDVAASDLKSCAVARCLRIDSLRALTPARRRNLLRYWLRLRGAPLPSTRKLTGLEQDLLNTDLDRMPCVTWQGAELRWHRGLLYVETASEHTAVLDGYAESWRWHDAFTLPAKLGTLTLSPTPGPGLSIARLPAELIVRFRHGGEKIQLPGRAHRHTLRNLFQEMDVLPWQRDRIPLIFANGELIGVGDLAWSGAFAAAPGEAALQVVWDGAPTWRAVRDRDE